VALGEVLPTFTLIFCLAYCPWHINWQHYASAGFSLAILTNLVCQQPKKKKKNTKGVVSFTEMPLAG